VTKQHPMRDSDGPFGLCAWIALVLATAALGCTGSEEGEAGPEADAPACTADQVLCDGRCVATATDPLNCGACGRACLGGQTCVGGGCQCQGGLSLCGGACVDLASDGSNCGACGRACAAPQVCSAGLCSATCGAGLTQCGMSCVDVSSSVVHCGGCGVACAAGESCTAGLCTCPAGQQRCGQICTDVLTDPSHCGACEIACAAGQSCSAGRCGSGGTGGTGSTGGATGSGGAGGAGGATTGGQVTGGSSSGGQAIGGVATGGAATGGEESGGAATGGTESGGATTGGATTGGAASGGAGTGGTESGGATTGGVSTEGGAGGCDPGTTTTAWATDCPTAPPTTCTAGSWVAGGPDPDHSGFRLLSESAHFVVYSDETPSGAQEAVDHLEDVWNTYFGAPMYMREPLCDAATKYKASVHVHSDWGLTGGAWTSNRMGMWIGSGGLRDHWGLAHEFMHAVQSVQGGMSCGGPQTQNYCGWVYESHANFSPHQLPEYANDVHCSELLANTPHLYLGSTRDRYCNWQFLEYLKDKHCYSAVNAIWTESAANDPFTNIMKGLGWDVSQLNDFIGDWAMHNVTWDYRVSGAAMRASYGPITDRSRPERRLRLTRLEPLGASWATDRRFQSPYYWAPQRFGYNTTRLYPEAGATHVRVTFRGVVQSGADSDWRWGLVAVNGSTPRYSALQRGAEGELDFCVDGGDSLYLVVAATPSEMQHIYWDQPYGTIYRYPYLVEFSGAWPEGYEGGVLAACPSGTTRITNGGGCGPASLNSTNVYVGPYALVTGGTVSGSARIEDHAQVLGGTVADGATVGGLTIFSGFTVGSSATTRTTFYPLDYFEGRSLSGGTLYGDVELRANRSSGTCSGFVDASTCLAPGDEVTIAPPYAWR